MKKLFFVAVALLFGACSTDVTEDVAIEVPETLTVSFEEESRIELANGKTVWTEGDLVSVFYRSDANQQWKFQGNTGDRSGSIKRVLAPEYNNTTSQIVIAYPYSENYYLNPKSCNLQAFLPAEQTYRADSYGLDGNVMVSQSEYKQFYLRSVCGWVKIQLQGEGQVVEKITLKGNNGEQVAGEIYINTADATATLAAEHGIGTDNTEVGGTMVEDDTILTGVTLNCGAGVTLGAEPTAFYIALPPQTFESGFTVTATCSDGSSMTKSTSDKIIVARNTIQPMESLDYKADIPNNQIWYTTTDGNVVTPYMTDVFGANIVSNTYENGQGVITFDADVTSIGNSAFDACSSLTSVTIGNSVTSIGDYAFYYCKSLTSVTIPESVTSIGSSAFYGCISLTSVTIGNNVTSIGNNAFRSCSSLTSVTIPDSVTSIGENAFASCRSLTSVTIGNSVTSIGDYAFRSCSSLQAFYGKYASSDNRCLVIDGVLNSFAPSSLTSYTIPDSVTSIGNEAFYGCSSLISITIPDSVTSIGDNAFQGCSSLTSVTIPDSVTSIGDAVFAECSSLQAFYGKYASSDNRCLVINEVLNSFAPSGLTSYTIPDSVTSIGARAFFYCSSLISVTIPDSVTSIGRNAFSGCSSLTSVYCKPTTPPTLGGTLVFFNNATDRKIYVPAASIDAYKTAQRWSDYADFIVGYDF